MTLTQTIRTDLYWEDHASAAVYKISELANTLSPQYISSLRRLMDEMIDSTFTSFTEINDESYWLRMGAYAYNNVHNVAFEDSYVCEVLAKKQRDYGPENIARFGSIGLVVRLHDKIARLENLLSNNKQANNESIEDTFLDIVGYSAIGVMWTNNQFLTPMKKK